VDVDSEAYTELADSTSSTFFTPPGTNESWFRSTSVCFRFLSCTSGSIELTAASNFASAGEPWGRDRNRHSYPPLKHPRALVLVLLGTFP